ncbi:MAG: hypothetical protein HS116_18960 [Planctomycetes bacterium]|nr:hypothetical protein [Planctomycetota bacterium]
MRNHLFFIAGAIGLCGALQAATALTPLQEIKQSETVNLDWVHRIQLVDGYALVVSHRGGAIHLYKRDAATGALEYRSSIPLAKELGHPGRHLDAFPVLTKRQMLYVTGCWTHANSNAQGLGLTWYRFDSEKGTATKLGRIESDAGVLSAHPCRDALLLSSSFGGSVQTIDLDPSTGEPKLGEKITGQGLGAELIPSPDGKHLYSLLGKQVGCLAVGSQGALNFAGTSALDGMEPKGHMRASALTFSPDGKHVYINLYGYGEKNAQGKYAGFTAMGLFTRDAASGTLTFVRALSVDRKMTGIITIVFDPTGTRGYYASGPETSGSCLGWFDRDPATGDVTYGGSAPGTARGVVHVAYDPKSGAVYAAGSHSNKQFWVFGTR